MADSLVVFGLLTAGIGLSFSASFFEPVTIHAKGTNFRSTQVLESHQVSFKGECALMCDSMGNSTCQGFNVRIKDGKNQCQLLQNIPINFNQFAEEEDFFLYERTCETMTVVASLRADFDGLKVTTLVDDQQRVYQISAIVPRLVYIGTITEVFTGHTGPVDDLLLVDTSTFGMLYGIRSGLVFHSYLPTDETYRRFTPNTEMMKIQLGIWLKYHNQHFVQVSMSLGTDNYLWVGRKNQKSSMHIKGDIVGPSTSASCPDQDRFGFCEWQPLWDNSDAAIAYSQTLVGVFIDTSFYIYDLESGGVQARYKVCRDRPALYLLSIDQ